MRAKGMGSNTIVTEVSAVASMKAILNGHEVMTMDEAAKVGDIFCTATGVKDIIVKRHSWVNERWCDYLQHWSL